MAGAFGGGTISGMFVFDGEGNYGIIVSSGGGFVWPQFSGSGSLMFSWRDSIFDLGIVNGSSKNFPEFYDNIFNKGISAIIGGGYDFGVNIGLDALFDTSGLSGLQINIGAGFSPFLGEGHALTVYTVLFPLSNKHLLSPSNSYKGGTLSGVPKGNSPARY